MCTFNAHTRCKTVTADTDGHDIAESLHLGVPTGDTISTCTLSTRIHNTKQWWVTQGCIWVWHSVISWHHRQHYQCMYTVNTHHDVKQWVLTQGCIWVWRREWLTVWCTHRWHCQYMYTINTYTQCKTVTASMRIHIGMSQQYQLTPNVPTGDTISTCTLSVLIHCQYTYKM